jgi:hypothetical protein
MPGYRRLTRVVLSPTELVALALNRKGRIATMDEGLSAMHPAFSDRVVVRRCQSMLIPDKLR